MVKDRFNQYYTVLLTELKALYSNIQGGTKFKNTPPSFPYMYFHQIGGEGTLSTLSGTEDGINLGIEVKVFSNKGATEARKIANSVREIMVEQDFHCDYFNPVENVNDTSIDQFILRFSKLET